MSQYKKRHPWLAALLNFISIGLGHVYAGNFARGVLLYIAALLSGPVLALALIYLGFPFNLIVFGAGAAGIMLFAMADSCREAQKAGANYMLKRCNKWYSYAVIIFCVLLLNSIANRSIKKHIVQSYRISSKSMQPQLIPGDTVLTDKLYYRSNEIRRGDIVVFKYPFDTQKNFLMRVVGLPGELIQVKDRRVYINDQLVPEDYIEPAKPVSVSDSRKPSGDFEPLRIPKGRVFVMGDNRELSYDSREWGPLNKSLIIGRAYLLFWSYDGTIRWERMGKVL